MKFAWPPAHSISDPREPNVTLHPLGGAVLQNDQFHIQPKKPIQYSLSHIDLLPTLLELLNIDHSFKNEIDGMSFTSLLEDPESMTKRDLYQGWGQKKRLLSDRHLMINEELYDLSVDPRQEQNIRNENPVLYDSLRINFDSWHASMPKEKELKEIPVGYLDYPVTVLPAHEANLFPFFEFRKDRRDTGIAYHSLHGWAHDWIDFWTNTSAYASWNLDAVSPGTYELELRYALSSEDKGATVLIEIQDQEILLDSLPVFEHSNIKNHDRILREQEAPETDWRTINAGTMELSEGLQELKVSSLKIPGSKSIELKDVILKRIK